MNSEVALIGAPCAGKTTILELLEPIFLSLNFPRDFDSNAPDFVVRHERWSDYQLFAQMLQGLFHSSGGILTPETLKGFAHWLKQQVVRKSILPREVDSYSGIEGYSDYLYFDTHVMAWKLAWLKEVTLYDLYWLAGFKFLTSVTEPITSLESLRQLMQADLLSAQLVTEAENLLQSFGENRITVFDGVAASQLLYLERDPNPFFVPVMREWHYTKDEMLTAKLASYPAVVLLETLANLPEGQFEHYFYDGIRLDTPQHARNLHQRLARMLEGHPNAIILPAAMSLEDKLERVLEVILNLVADQRRTPT